MKTGLKKNRRILGSLLFGFFILLLGASTFALTSLAQTSSTTPVKTLPGVFNTEDITPGQLVLNIYKYALGVVGVVAFGAVIYGAVLWVISAGMPGKKTEAKDWIMGAVYGILLLFGAYVLFNTINPEITKIGEIDKNLGLETIKVPEADVLADFLSKYGTDGLRNLPDDSVLTNDAAKILLRSQYFDIAIKEGVSLEGIRKGTLDEVTSLKKDLQDEYQVGLNDRSTGSITITAGTDGTHTEGTYDHAGGYKVDLRLNEKLNTYVQGNYTRIADRVEKNGSRTPQWQSPRGTIYAREIDHWDVLVKPS